MKTLRAYQVPAVKMALRQNLLLADSMGLGKTVVTAELIRCLALEDPQPALIVAPKQLCSQWRDEIADQCPAMPIYILNASDKLPAKPFARQAIAVITHYEALVKHTLTLSKTFWGLVVCDEAHRIKNRNALRSKAVKKLKAYRKLALTGTPYGRDPSDIWSVLNWLQPQQFTSYWAFYKQFIDYEEKIAYGTNVKYQIVRGLKQPAAFARVLKPHVLMRKKSDVAPQLPDKIIQNIPIILNPDQQKVYDKIQAVADLEAEISEGNTLLIKNVLTKILRLQQAALDPRLLGVEIESTKLEWLNDWLSDNPDETLLILTRFRDTAQRIAHKYTIPCVIGGKPLEKPETHPVIVGTIDALSEGLNLGHIWNTVFLDCVWSGITMPQALERTERDLSATVPRHIMYLTAQNTVDELVRATLDMQTGERGLVDSYLRARQEAKKPI